MNLRIVTQTAIICIVLTVLAVSCKCGGEVMLLTPNEVAALVRDDTAILVDVREADEVEGGMAEKALWIPTSKIQNDAPEWQIFKAKLATDYKDKQIVFYCAAGVRAQYAATQVADLGYRSANMGGFADWQTAGLPIAQP